MSARSHRFVTGPVAASLLIALVAGAPTASASDPLNLYFGDLHAHTAFSDGAHGTTPADAYAAARAAGADFMATTDHHGSLTSEEWAATLEMAGAATTASFVALPGYEAWVVGVGEINVFGTDAWPKEPVGRGADKADSGHHHNRWQSLPLFYDWLAAEPGAVGQWNHPTAYAGKSSEDFIGYAGWSADHDTGMGLIEVFNYLAYEASYVRALDAGWHVMPAANSDTHAPNWISGADMRTVLLAPALTADDLLAAMRAGRGYATLDRNLRVRFEVNGQPMGSVLDGSSSAFDLHVTVEDPDAIAADAITAIEIVSDGGIVVASGPVGGTSADWTVSLVSGTSRYYYLRISTATGIDDVPGPTAWTAPVWTGR
jgi:hypothetical protein